ncbi:helix-turn-helix domain-containing protein [Bradyrhizobium lupini]|uniref:helix-turn-helix domain-containing protein n=1 Tax=Rhizobium lupini TaxID=136996 RepID=UPI00366D7DED
MPNTYRSLHEHPRPPYLGSTLHVSLGLRARVGRRPRLLNLSFTILTYDDAPQRFCWHESMSNNRQEIRPWSPEEEAQLLALFNEGMTAGELAERLGRSRQAVYGRLQRFRRQLGRVSRTSGRAFAQWQ